MARKSFFLPFTCRLHVLVLAISLTFVTVSMAQETYEVPPEALQKLVDAPQTPRMLSGPGGVHAALLYPAGLPAIAELASPELRLAGMRINPAIYGPSRTRPYTSITLLNVINGGKTAVNGIPEGARIRNVSWSPDGKLLAFTLDLDNKIELFVANTEDGSARKLLSEPINDSAYGVPYHWVSDSQSILLKSRPDIHARPPEAPRVLAGPIVQESTGETAAARTYQDLLKNTHDEEVFSHFMLSQLIEVSLDGTTRLLGSPDMIIGAEPSPSGEFILVETLEQPFSYLVPAGRFPHTLSVWNRSGEVVYTLASLPLAENVPTAFGSVPLGVRSASWRADTPATLVWTEAQDEGNAQKEVAIRDHVYMQSAPFNSPPVLLAQLELRFAGVTWGNDTVALIDEVWWSSRQRRTHLANPSDPSEGRVLFDVSMEDRYNDPGDPMTYTDKNGQRRLLIDNNNLFLEGEGASPEGERPFVRKMNLSSGETIEVFRSQAPYYELPVGFLDNQHTILMTRRESQEVPPNYYRRNLKSGEMTAVTDFAHPYPEFAGIQKTQLTYERADGIGLSSTLYTPPNYDAANDGPLPTLLWAYPREFKNAQNAGQVTGSPYEFKSVSYWGAIPFVTQGFAILDQTAMPVIGEGDAEPNDTFVEQLIMNAEAAIQAGAQTGAVDPDRVAIAGHSYGAFMTANLLAHSDLFKAGIARSGAYNRTLTPFGFQREERTFWEAPEIYFAMSPFMHAHKVNEPILLIHGAADNNSGTFPIQSQRFYAALKGHGAKARLVMLPHESHGYRAKESLNHMLFEMNSWLQTHVSAGPQRIDTPQQSEQ